MLGQIFKRKPQGARVYATPAGQSAYIVGDVHGCYVELRALLKTIADHAKHHAPDGYKLVFLGDLIDRGPDSQKVVEFLKDFSPENVELIYLMGNHEEVYLRVVEGQVEALKSWFGFGGRSCLRSYGVDNLGEINLDIENLLFRAQSKIPKSHVEFIRGFQDYFVFGDYLCVHAGIRPKKKLEDQKSQDMRWIRGDFLKYSKPHPYKVVHGHTIVEQAQDFGNRIAVDTGAYNDQVLSAVFLQDEIVEFLTS